MMSKSKKMPIVLVGVVKNKRDLEIVLKEGWYRIPVKYAPIKEFEYLAFYEPKSGGLSGKQIRYYARVRSMEIVKRQNILPKDLNHPRSMEFYILCRLGKIQKLQRSIKNTTPRRVTFAFTTLSNLHKAKNLLEVYNVSPIEEIMAWELQRVNVVVQKEFTVRIKNRHFRLDFAIFCKKGKIALECDNKDSHSSTKQRTSDQAKDNFLLTDGWTVLRLTEKEIIENTDECVRRVKMVIHQLGRIE